MSYSWGGLLLFKCWWWHLKEKNQEWRKWLPVIVPLYYPFTRLEQYISRSSSGACILRSLVCFSVIAHHCHLCARASNNGLSGSCSTCFSEAFKSFHDKNCFITFLWLIYNTPNCNKPHTRLHIVNTWDISLISHPEEPIYCTWMSGISKKKILRPVLAHLSLVNCLLNYFFLTTQGGNRVEWQWNDDSCTMSRHFKCI